MRLVREYIEFEREGSPHKKMDIGEGHRIEDWLEEHDFEEGEYKINSDFSIDVFDDTNLVGYGMEELPDYIQFNKIYGGFYAGSNPWQSLKGFPKEIQGDLQISSPSTHVHYMRKFTEDEIRKIIKVEGYVYIN